jgi:hypothetical protein
MLVYACDVNSWSLSSIGRAILGEFALDYDEACLTAGIFFDFY